jgi:ABC-2 type transport system ATP-binding protein
MQHAERLCERILLIAQGQKLFDGTIAEAKRRIPRRVLIETASGASLDAIHSLPEVVGVNPLPPKPGDVDFSQWEVHVRDNADASAILRACFERGIHLRSFHPSEPTLHDVFVQLVGPAAREASFR